MKVFEREIIDELLSNREGESIVIPKQESEEVIDFTGAGYFLTLKDLALPKHRIVLDKPDIRGQLGGVDVGYLAFCENHELTLECYTYEQEISALNREQGFERAKT